MTREEILDALCAMLPAEFEVTLAKLSVPAAYLSGVQAAQATRVTEAVRWMEAQGRLSELGQRLRPTPTPSAGPQVSIARLPVTGRYLFGRDTDLAWLDACWRDGVHVATVVAWGGVGKSALVNTWLAKVRDAGWRSAERVYGWSFYSQGTSDMRVTSADEFINAALQWFGDADPTRGSPWDKGERLARLVRAKRTLLVLDGMEPLQAGPGVQEGRITDPALKALVRELGAENKGLCVITTRIGVTDLEGGDKVREQKLEDLLPEAGAELLKARGAQGTEEELRDAVKEYGGHSLALTLLGSYLDDACEGDIRRRHEIGPLEGDERLGKHAQRVMAAYERWFKSGPEIAIVRMLGLFDRPADEGEIAALREAPRIEGLTDALMGLGEQKWNKAVAKLRRAGLLAADVQDKRLDAHPLVREHFGEQVRQAYPEAWREGHQRLYEHLEKKAKPLPDTIEEMGPVHAAVVHGCLAGRHQDAIELYWKRAERGQEGFNWNRLGAFGSEVAVLSAFFDPPWEQLADGLNDRAERRILNAAGFTLRALGRLPEAERLMRKVLGRNEACKDWKDAARDAGNLSDLFLVRGDLKEALVRAKQSIELADRSGDAVQRATKSATLGAVLHQMGRRAEASVQFEEFERIHREQARDAVFVFSLASFRICDALLDQGTSTEVLARARASLEISTRSRRLLAIGLDHVSLGRANLLAAQREASGDTTQAAEHLKQAVENMRRANRQDHLPRGLLARADLHIFTRAFPAARRDLDEALTLATRCGFRLHEADAHLAYARLHVAEADPARAREHLEHARAIVQATGYHRRDEELARVTTILA